MTDKGEPTYCDTCDREVAVTDDDDRHIFETLEFTPVLSQFINWNTIGDRATQFWANVDVRRRSDGSTVVTLWAVK